jgi:phage protein D
MGLSTIFVEQKVQLDIAFVTKLAKAFGFFTQVLRQFLLRKNQQSKLT